MNSNEPNEIAQFLIEKEYMKEKVIIVIDKNDEEKYTKFIKEGIESGKILYPALFVDYLIDNDNNNYTGEFVKKVDINWKEFYEKKDYQKEKEEDEKEEKKEDSKDTWKVDDEKNED